MGLETHMATSRSLIFFFFSCGDTDPPRRLSSAEKCWFKKTKQNGPPISPMMGTSVCYADVGPVFNNQDVVSLSFFLGVEVIKMETYKAKSK